jgi:hypothetical protein
MKAFVGRIEFNNKGQYMPLLKVKWMAQMVNFMP